MPLDAGERGTVLTADGLGVHYPRTQESALSDICLEIETGETVWVLGPNGSGKSSLGLAIAGMLPGVVPGRRKGDLLVLGSDPSALSPAMRVSLTGIIHQDPSTQLCTLSVESEVALLLENKNRPPEEIRRRVAEVIRELGIEHLTHRDVLSLSGGEKQLVALASLALDPPAVLVLDEPCAYLDSPNRALVLRTLRRLKDARPELSLVFIEHRTDGLPPPDRVYRLDNGKLDVTAPEVGRRVAAGAEESRPGPEGPPTAVAPLLKVEDLSFSYPGQAPVLEGISLEISAGETVVLHGRNGSGKTTLIRLIAGALKPSSGAIHVAEFGSSPAVALVPQNPEHLIVGMSVEEELDSSGAPGLASRFGLEDLLDRNPYTLSTGQKRRLNLAVAGAQSGKLVLMDEPTFGLDDAGVRELVGLVGELTRSGKGVLIVTHDEAFAAAVADRRIRLGDDSRHTSEATEAQEGGGVLGRLNPLTRMGVALLFVLGASVVYSAPVLGVWLSVGLVTLLAATSLGPWRLLRRMLPFALIGLGFLWANLLFHRSGDPLAGLRNGLMLFLRALVFGVYSLVFVQDISPEGFARSLMAHLHAPARLVYATLIAFRLGPELHIERDTVRLALKLRGIPRGFRRTMQVFFAVFVSAFRRAGRISMALEGRGLDSGPRSHLRIPRFRRKDLIFGLLGVTLFVVPLVLFGLERWAGGYF